MVCFSCKAISVFTLFSMFGLALGGDRWYDISFTTYPTGSDSGTSTPVWFRIIGTKNGIISMTDWFKIDSMPLYNTKYDFSRCLDDVGDIEKIQFIRKNPDHVVAKTVSVDDKSYTFSSAVRVGCCTGKIMDIDFVQQTHDFTQTLSNYNTVLGSTPAPTVCNPTQAPSELPTPRPTKRPTLASCEYTHTCAAWGDPHIDTFDNTRYHFQGEGVYDYVTTCPGSSSVPLPLTISAVQTKCRGDFTCITQVIIRLLESNNAVTTITLDQDGSVSHSKGSYQFIDINGHTASYTISNSNGMGVFEIDFVYDDGTAKQAMFKVSYHKTRLVIDGSDCIFGELNSCGLCGNINDDKTDDFISCINGQQMERGGWIKSHEFGETCCNQELDFELFDESDCGDVGIVYPPEPSVECIVEARNICDEAYDKYCKDCTSAVGASNEFLEDCAVDMCGMCEDNVGNVGFGVDQAVSEGCLDPSINKCVWDRLDEINDIVF